MRHGEGFERAIADYRRRASGNVMYLGLPESGNGEIGGQVSKYPYRVFTKGLDSDKAYSGTEIFEQACLQAKSDEKWNESDIEALMARLATTIHANHGSRVSKEKLKELAAESNPAGYTYLAQFAIHDMTFSSPGGKGGGASPNLATPRLDLGTLYGDGHTANHMLFEHKGPGEVRGRFRIGYTTDGKAGSDNSWVWRGVAWKRDMQEDIPRIPLSPACGYTDELNAHEPALADTRNADNLILSQMAVLFMKFHNKLFDKLSQTKYEDDESGAFDAAKRVATGVYNSVIVNDLLWRLLEMETWDRYFGESRGQLPDDQHVSREAAFAILRFGHSMVRDEYDYSDGQPFADLPRLLDFFGLPVNGALFGLPLNSSWIIDWQRFFDIGGLRAVNRAHLFAPAMNEILMIHSAVKTKPSGVILEHPLGLAFRTLMKGIFHNLPTGQAVAAHMRAEGYKVEPLSKKSIADSLGQGRAYGSLPSKLLVTDEDLDLLSTATPLFAYMLVEAEIIGNGIKLGPVGGDFVAHAFACGLKGGSGHSPWATDWNSCGFGIEPPSTMPSLICFVRNECFSA